MIGSLSNNGGPTQTHALLLGSPAIDLVPLASCNVSTDQRGIARPQGAACDSGSYEHPPTLPQQCSGNIGNYNIIQGTNGNDNLNGGAGRDLIFAYGGNGNDDLRGGSGNDFIDGEAGIDDAAGNSGTDTCSAETEISCEL